MNQEINTVAQMPEKEARTWAMICHLAALSGYMVVFSSYLFPFGNVLGPLIVWAIKKDQSPFIDDQGKEALNFQLTMTIAGLACFALMFVLIGIVLFPVLYIYSIVMIIIAAIKSNEGVYYRYPYTIRFFK